ncbi:MAG: deoxyribonuclease IV [candidate division WOR-3 bacterium]
MRFGFHVSIAGGLDRAIPRAQERRCQALHLFIRNPRGWQARELVCSEVEKFRTGVSKLGLQPVVVHLTYLPNLASSDRRLWQKSVHALAEDLRRAALIGAHYLLAHIGHAQEDSISKALARVARSIDEAFACCQFRDETGPILLLENTAGTGKGLGSRLGHLQTVIASVQSSRRLGIAFDTAHAFAAGYELRTRLGLDETLGEFDSLIGLCRLKLLHLNDTRVDLGSGKDRHWHIGRGNIGQSGFREIINHPSLSLLPGILETPGTELRQDLENLRTVLALMASDRRQSKALSPAPRVS